MYNMMYILLMSDVKEILWEGDSFQDLMSFPEEVRHKKSAIT